MKICDVCKEKAASSIEVLVVKTETKKGEETNNNYSGD